MKITKKQIKELKLNNAGLKHFGLTADLSADELNRRITYAGLCRDQAVEKAELKELRSLAKHLHCSVLEAKKAMKQIEDETATIC